jgi:uncharacterized protein
MYHHWNWITFLHWRYPPAVVQRLLPPGLTAETFDGTAWIGLTPFLMEGIRPPVLPALPWLSRFGEVNVRTYVHDDQGRSGIWFFSLDAARLPAVAGAGRLLAALLLVRRQRAGNRRPDRVSLPPVPGGLGPV